MATNKDKAATKKTSINKKDILQSNDKKIDDDFPGFPSNPSKQNMINPETKTDKLVSGTDKKMERKSGKPILKQEHTTSKTKKKKADSSDQNGHVGSGGAFEGTEDVRD